VDITPDLTVILDNSTRWNSTYLLIQRGLRLKGAIQLYLNTLENGGLEMDSLDAEEW
jgi:hypothetical protein